jgi:hypothetical protein
MAGPFSFYARKDEALHNSYMTHSEAVVVAEAIGLRS